MENTCIKVLNKEHGKLVIAYYKWLGVDINQCKGDGVNNYYGLFDGKFNLFCTPRGSKIIELPKDFFNPEEPWYIKVDKNNINVLNEWVNKVNTILNFSLDTNSIVGLCLWGSKKKEYNYKLYDTISSGDMTNKYDYTFGQEITFEQFRKYILKEDIMSTEKKISGYKLTKPEYKGAALLICKTVNNWENSNASFDIRIDQTGYIDKLKAAGVFDIWFKPVYLEELSMINGYKGTVIGDIIKYGCAEFNIDGIKNLIETSTHLGNRIIAEFKLDSGVIITLHQFKEMLKVVNNLKE